MYECLTHVAKVALTLSHSNAIPERSFSVNNAMLGNEKLSLGENTIVALHIVKDTIRLCVSETSVSYIWKNSDVRKQLNYMKQWSLKRY